VLEAMVTGTPVVATNLAVEGMGLSPGLHVLTADSPRILASETVRLLTDTSLQAKLGKTGKSFVKKRYSWDTIAKDLDQVYQEFKHAV
jgi:glycosyltransferase involved in cell wall biosynthesis